MIAQCIYEHLLVRYDVVRACHLLRYLTLTFDRQVPDALYPKPATKTAVIIQQPPHSG